MKAITGSHPTWVRGLKFNDSKNDGKLHRSHPTWVRGLKLDYRRRLGLDFYVAPHVGAWIEMQAS